MGLFKLGIVERPGLGTDSADGYARACKKVIDGQPLTPENEDFLA